MILFLVIVAAIASLAFVMIKLDSYIEGDDVAPWRKFTIACPVCRKPKVCWKAKADARIETGFGVRNMDAPACKRCTADMAEPYMRHPYVAELVAEAKRAERFKAEAAEYNAAIKTARKGAAA